MIADNFIRDADGNIVGRNTGYSSASKLRSVVWESGTSSDVILGRAQATVEVNNFKGTVLHADTDYGPVPRAVLDAPMQNIVLASGPIKVAGSFAPTVDSAGFTHVPTDHSTVIYYDGTNNSKRIVKRRVDGYDEVLPPGHLAIDGLTPGAQGGIAPTYYFFPFSIPGACNLGWVPGNLGTPAFAHSTITADAIAQQRTRGREPLTDGPLTLQLLPVAVPIPVAPPPPPVPSSGGAGTLSLAVQNPGANSQQFSNGFHVMASATDTTYTVSGWAVYDNNGTIPFFSTPGPQSSIDVIATLTPGTHTLTIRVWNSNGNFTSLDVVVNVVDPPPPEPQPSSDPVLPIGPCVMLGTEIVPIGESEWWREEMPQNEWSRLYTAEGRELVAVPTHRIYTGRAGLTEMRDVRKGDKIVTVMGEETVADIRLFSRPGVKVCVHMKAGHLYWANGVLSHNIKLYNTY